MPRRLLFALLIVTAGSDGIAAAQEIDTASIDALFAEYDRPDTPGCSIGIVIDGELVYSRGYGSANLEHQVPNGPETVFEIGSASKAFTSLSLALLIDEGLISPDDELRTLLPESPDQWPAIRVRDLVQCRTGLWCQFHLLPLAGWENLPIQSPHSLDDTLVIVYSQPALPFEPGTEFKYGSTDYLFLGEIIRKVTGLSLAEFADERIFTPLGMTQTFYETDPSLVVPHRAICYYEDRDGVRRQWKNHAYYAGGSGVLASVNDLAAFERSFLDSPFPSGEYVDHYLATGTLLDNRNCLDALPKDEYRGLRRFQFTGGVWGAASAMLRFPDQRVTFICLANNERIRPWIMCERMADIVLADQLDPVNAELAAALAELDQESAIELSDDELAMFAGTYRAVDAHFTWDFDVVDGDLLLDDHVHKLHVLEPVAFGRFRPVPPTPFDPTARLTFTQDESTGDWTLSESWYSSENLRSTEFRPTTLATPCVDELEELAGVYECEPLAIAYRFRVDGDALHVRVGPRHWEQLDPLLVDEFIPHDRSAYDQRVFRFQRDVEGQVMGLTVSFWRIDDMPLVRLNEAVSAP